MGSYSELYIGKLYLSWKNQIPSFLTFLFEKNDLYSKRSRKHGCYDALGYRTTARRSLLELEKYGYSLEFIAEIYDHFYEGVYWTYSEEAKDRIAENSDRKLSEAVIEKKFSEHIRQFSSVARVNELRDFIIFLRALMVTDFTRPPFDKPYRIRLDDGKTYLVNVEEYLSHTTLGTRRYVDFEALQSYVRERVLDFPPWIFTSCGVFGQGYFYEYPEIVSIMFAHCALEAVDPESEVRLELSGVIDDRQEALDLHQESAYGLLDKVDLYNRVFKCLSDKEERIRDAYVKTECRNLLGECERSKGAHKKGLVLERLVEVLFTSNNHFDLVSKRVSTGDEEIDIVVKNNIDRPFWMAFNSPLIFVECKNWRKPVGAKEIRDFEMKMRNHAKLSKVGFIVCMSGFTRVAVQELKRAGRDDFHIVLLEQGDLRHFVESSQSFYEWLENHAATLH
jgi:hypothetical protein